MEAGFPACSMKAAKAGRAPVPRAGAQARAAPPARQGAGGGAMLTQNLSIMRTG